MKDPTELQKLQWENKALRDALQYLVDTKNRKDTIGKDPLYLQRKSLGWAQARHLLATLEITQPYLEIFTVKQLREAFNAGEDNGCQTNEAALYQPTEDAWQEFLTTLNKK